MRIIEHRGDFFLSLENGSEYELTVEYDYSPPQKADMTDPAFPAEFCITYIELLDNGFVINPEWIKNLEDFQNEMAARAEAEPRRKRYGEGEE